jgi:hypothetical protein
MVRIFFFTCAMLFSFLYSIYKLFNDDYINFFIIFIIFLTTTYLLLFGRDGDYFYRRCFVVLIALPLTSYLSYVDLFSTSSVFKSDKQAKNMDIVLQSNTNYYCSISAQPDRSKRSEFYKIRKNVELQCMLEPINDGINFVNDFYKIGTFGLYSSLADNIYKDSFKKDKISCEDLARRANKLCPGFYRIE